jgi:chromate transporter
MNPFNFFAIFLKATLLSTSGLGNLPFLQKDLTALGWAKNSDFVTAIAVSQISPGPTGLWSISLGYLIYGWLGATLALVALSLPPLLTLAVSASYNHLKDLAAVQDFTRGLSMGVVGFTIAVAFSLAGSSIQDWRGIAIAACALGLALSKRVPVILILALAALAGCLLYGL